MKIPVISYFIRKIGNLKINTKMMLSHLLSIGIPMLMILFFLGGNLRDMVISNTISEEQNTSQQAVPEISGVLTSVNNVRDSLITYLDGRSGIKIASSLNFLLDEKELLSLEAEAERLTEEYPELDLNVRVYLQGESVPAVSERPDASRVVQPEITISSSYWHGIFSGKPQLTELLCPSFYLTHSEIDRLGGLCSIRKFMNGWIAVYFSQSYMSRLLDDASTLNGGVTYLVNSRNSIAAASDAALAGTYMFNYETIRDYFMSSNNYIVKNVLGKEVYTGFYSVADSDWFMVAVLPKAPILEKAGGIIARYLLIFVGGMVIAFLLSLSLSRYYTSKILSVVQQMEKVREGPPLPMEPSGYTDEVGTLIDTYNYMAGRINVLMEDQARAAEELRISEFNSLQAQINPHFLYNTMDLINWQAKSGQSEDVTRTVQNLSRFYKLTLSRRNTISTIEAELEHIEIYVEIQNMRFKDGIDLVVDIPDSLMDYQIPKLTLQPVIENAILHGIMEKDEKKGTILLTGWTEKQDIILLVSDDGVGMDPERLKTILSGEGTSKTGSNIAIYNTHRRLQLLYGSRYGLFYQSRPGEGTEVQIRFPAIQENS